MVLAVGQHLRVTVTQRLLGVDADLLNVFYYQITGITGSPVLNESGVGLEAWWRDEVGGKIASVQVTSLVHQKILVESMENWATEFIEIPLSPAMTGSAPGDPAPTSVAWSFKYNRELRITRHGRKSIPGVPEGFTAGNSATPSALPLLVDVAVYLGQGWTIDNLDGSGWVMGPRIAKTPVPPATLPSVYNGITAVSYRGIGTQNTRKRLQG